MKIKLPIKSLLKNSRVNWYFPVAISIIPTLIIILISPVDFMEYQIEGTSKAKNRILWFDDLEGDGEKEFFRSLPNTNGALSIQHYDDIGTLVDQYNFTHGPLQDVYPPVVPLSADFNNDQVKDIVIFSQSKDSLFVKIFDIKSQDAIVQGRFITKIGIGNNKFDFGISQIGFADTNNDSVPEFFFSVTGYFSLYPRRIFRYDVKNDILISSVNTGAAIVDKSTILDSVEGGLILVPAVATNNVPNDYAYPYHDSSVWLFGLNFDLEFVFEPIQFEDDYVSIGNLTSYQSHFYFLISSAFQDRASKLIQMDTDGNIVYSKVFNYKIHSVLSDLDSDHGMMIAYPISDYGIIKRSKPYILNLDTKELTRNRLLNRLGFERVLFKADFDLDGNDELVVFRLPGSIDIYNQYGKLLCAVDAKIDAIHYMSYNFDKESKSGIIIFGSESEASSSHIAFNPISRFKYLVWFGYYLGSLIFVSTIFIIQDRRNRKLAALEGSISKMYLKNLQSQLDPHFTMNALNTLGNYIYKEDRDAAYDMFQRFTNMIRISLEASDTILHELYDELEFTKNYLELQLLRFPDLFLYSIDLDPQINPHLIRVPRLIVQIFTENSIKHAFRIMQRQGRLIIRIAIQEGKVVIEIEDNGPGLKSQHASTDVVGTKKGLRLIREQIRLTNLLYKTNFSLEVLDRSQINDDQTGTLVRFFAG